MNETTEWKLKESRLVSGQIEVVTGLRIGANVETMEISGLDNPIIRNPANDEPYIPGSSLKGKLRSLAEWYLGELPLPSGDLVRDCKTDGSVARVFGVAAQRQRQVGPTRTLVRDARLSKQDRRSFAQGREITEVKTENSINRLTAMANPRPMERVLPGVRFAFEIVYRIFDAEGDGGRTDEENFERVLLTAMRLLEQDYLGSSGSRGCGQIRFAVADGNGGTRPGVMVNGEPRELPVVAATNGGG
ncbi:MAG: type III-A CRISPR-associated RAMP protein Csm3 [Phycisphaerae bacterium]